MRALDQPSFTLDSPIYLNQQSVNPQPPFNQPDSTKINHDPSEALLELRIRPWRLLIASLVLAVFLVVITVALEEGFVLATLAPGESLSWSLLKSSNISKQVDDLNGYSGNAASALSALWSLALQLIVYVLVLAIIPALMIDNSTMWAKIALLSITGGFAWLATQGFVATNVQLKPANTIPVLSFADLNGFDGDLLTNFQNYTPFVVGPKDHLATSTLLRTAISGAYPRETAICNEFDEGDHDVSVSYGFSSYPWLRHVLPSGSTDTRSLHLAMNASANSSSSALPMPQTNATSLAIWALEMTESLFGVQMTPNATQYESLWNDFGGHQATDDTNGFLHAFQQLASSILSDQKKYFQHFSMNESSAEFAKIRLSDTITFDAITLEIPLKRNFFSRTITADLVNASADTSAETLTYTSTLVDTTDGEEEEVIYEMAVWDDCNSNGCMLSGLDEVSSKGTVTYPESQVLAVRICLDADGIEDALETIHGCQYGHSFDSFLVFSIASRIEGQAMVIDSKDDDASPRHRKLTAQDDIPPFPSDSQPDASPTIAPTTITDTNIMDPPTQTPNPGSTAAPVPVNEIPGGDLTQVPLTDTPDTVDISTTGPATTTIPASSGTSGIATSPAPATPDQSPDSGPTSAPEPTLEITSVPTAAPVPVNEIPGGDLTQVPLTDTPDTVDISTTGPATTTIPASSGTSGIVNLPTGRSSVFGVSMAPQVDTNGALESSKVRGPQTASALTSNPLAIGTSQATATTDAASPLAAPSPDTINSAAPGSARAGRGTAAELAPINRQTASSVTKTPSNQATDQSPDAQPAETGSQVARTAHVSPTNPASASRTSPAAPTTPSTSSAAANPSLDSTTLNPLSPSPESTISGQGQTPKASPLSTQKMNSDTGSSVAAEASSWSADTQRRSSSSSSSSLDLPSSVDPTNSNASLESNVTTDTKPSNSSSLSSSVVYKLSSAASTNLAAALTRKAYLKNARKIYTITVGRMSWKLEDLAERFGARCNITHNQDCQGLAFDLSNSSQKLIVGRLYLPLSNLRDYSGSSYLWTPLAKIKRDAGFGGDFASSKAFHETNWPNDLNGTACKSSREVYLTSTLDNHLYTQHSLQPAYTTALMWLFQYGTANDIIDVGQNKQSLAFSANIVRNLVVLSTPSNSSYLTYAACTLVVLLSLVVSLVAVRQQGARPERPVLVRTVAEVLLKENQYPPAFLTCYVHSAQDEAAVNRNAIGTEEPALLRGFEVCALELENRESLARVHLSDSRSTSPKAWAG